MIEAATNCVTDALAELLRLYDWRFELAKMEAAVKAGNFLLAPEVKRLLRQYGEEKKAAWAVAREVLRGGETAIRGSQSSREHSEGEIPSPATNAAPQVPAVPGRNEGQSQASGPDLVDTPAAAAHQPTEKMLRACYEAVWIEPKWTGEADQVKFAESVYRDLAPMFAAK